MIGQVTYVGIRLSVPLTFRTESPNGTEFPVSGRNGQSVKDFCQRRM